MSSYLKSQFFSCPFGKLCFWKDKNSAKHSNTKAQIGNEPVRAKFLSCRKCFSSVVDVFRCPDYSSRHFTSDRNLPVLLRLACMWCDGYLPSKALQGSGKVMLIDFWTGEENTGKKMKGELKLGSNNIHPPRPQSCLSARFRWQSCVFAGCVELWRCCQLDNREEMRK